MRVFTFSRQAQLASASVFLFGALCLVVNSGYSYGFAVLVLMGLATWRTAGAIPLIIRQSLHGLLCFVIVQCALVAWHQEGWPRFGDYLQFLLVYPVMWAVVYWRVKPAYFIWGVVLGAVLTAIWAVWQKVVLGVPRAEGFTNTIQHGNIALLMGVTALLGAFYAHQQRWSSVAVAGLLLGAISGFLGSVLTGTRGGWLGLPLVLWFLWQHLSPVLSGAVKRTVAGCVLGLIALVIVLPATGVQARLLEAKNELSLALAGDLSGESLGNRLNMWRAGVEMVTLRPMMGWGEESALSEIDRRVEANELQRNLGHFHNEFMQQAVNHGLIGLLALCGCYGALLWRLRSSLGDSSERVWAVGVFVLLLLYIDYGLSQTMFYRNAGRVAFIVWLGVLLGFLAQQRLVNYKEPKA